MAGYTGGGGGGAAVVPANQVVASDREDELLTQAGLVAAIAALPAGGGDIYLGAGTLSIASVITIDRDIRLFGAGPGATIISVATGISAFQVGDFRVEMQDIEFQGDDSASQKIILITANAANHNNQLVFRGVNVGNETGFGPTQGIRTIVDFGGFQRRVLIEGCRFLSNAAGDAFANTTGGQQMLVTGTKISNTGTITFPQQSQVSGCVFSTGTFNSGTLSSFSACMISGTTLNGGIEAQFAACDRITFTTCNIGASGGASACSFAGSTTVNLGNLASVTGCSGLPAVVATGTNVRVVGCGLDSFSSAVAGRDGHVIKGNRFAGAGNNVTLTDSDDCIVKGNISCQVNETATSDNNRYANISTSSTIIGASSVIEDAQKFVFTSPGTLTTTDNDLFARVPVQVTTPVRLLSIEVQTAPTGASVLVAFRKGTRSTGVLAAAFATLTLTAGSFTASTSVAGITVAPTEFLTVEITQVGSGVPGSSATIVARG